MGAGNYSSHNQIGLIIAWNAQVLTSVLGAHHEQNLLIAVFFMRHPDDGNKSMKIKLFQQKVNRARCCEKKNDLLLDWS